MVDYTDYITQGAIARGLDPRAALRTVDTEGGRSGKVGDSGTSFGPFQMHVGGIAPGTTAKGLGDAMLAQGLDPKNPYQSIDFALDYAKAHGGTFSPDIWHGLRGGAPGPGEHRWVGDVSGGGSQPLYLGTLEKNFHQPTGNDLLDALLNLNVPKEDKTGNPLLDQLMQQAMLGTGPANQAQPAPDAAKALGRTPQALPPETVPELSGQQVDIKPMQPLQPAAITPPEPAKEVMPSGRPSTTPEATPPVPTSQPGAAQPPAFQQASTGNGLLDRIFKQLSPISTAQAAETPPAPQPVPATPVAPPPIQPTPAPPAVAPQTPTQPFIEPPAKGQQVPPPVQPRAALPAPQAQPTGSGLLDRIIQQGDPEAALGQMARPVTQALGETGKQLLDMFLLNPLEAGARGISGQDAPGTPQAIEDAMAGAQLASAGSIGRGGMGAGPRLPERIEPPPIGARGPAGEAPSEPLAPKQPEISPPATPPGAPPGGGVPPPPPPGGGVLGAQPQPAGPGITASLQAASKGIQKIFSPTTVDSASRMAERLFREMRGRSQRETAQAEGQISGRGPLSNPSAANMVEAAREPWRPIVAKYIPEFERYLASVRAGATPMAKPTLLRFLDFVEGRSSGVTYTGPPELRGLANIMQSIFADRSAKILAEPSTQWAGFIQDYFPHMWKERQRASFSGGAGSGGQGSGRSLRQRTGPPTISDGIAAGLTPKSADPIEMMMDYVANIDRYLAHNRIFRIGRQGGMIRFYAPGQEPPDWVRLEGRLAARAVATGGVPNALGLNAYAPEGFARVYNNAIGTGFFEGQMGGPVYSAILRVKNGITQTVLSLSGYHPLAMAQEATASGIANAIQGLKHGDIVAVAKQLGLAAMTGAKAVGETFGKGRKLERQYSGVQDYGPDWERIADLWARGGGQGLTRGAEWKASPANNFITTFRRGMTGMELRAGLRHIGEGDNILSQTGRAIAFVADQMGRIMDTVTAPLFDTMVPRLKKAAFFDEMSEWLRQNPTASPDAQIARAREVLDRMDDRFGEMVMDNIFWAKRAKQTLNILSTSLGWELGSVRSLAGAPFDVLRGQFASPRVRYAIGLGTAIAIENAMYQYLKTGKTPGQGTGGLLSAGGALDLTVPRTGGTTPEGAYERELLPGFEKDVLGYWKDPAGEFAGKLSPFGKVGVEMFTGRDQFTGKPIDDYPKYTPEWFKAWGDHLIGSMAPIPFRQEIYKGSNIPAWERFMGGRPAPEYLQNPQRLDQIELSMGIKDLKKQMATTMSHDRRTGVDPEVTKQHLAAISDQIRMLERYYQKRLDADMAAHARHFPPKVGERGPMGGTVTHTYSYQQPATQ